MKQITTINLKSRFYYDVDINQPLKEYPRPQLRRKSYLNLNGVWKCSITKSKDIPSIYEHEIIVPFAIPTLLSKVDHVLQIDEFLHYKKEFHVDEDFLKSITLLHFGAVDQSCDVFLNDQFLGSHIGGYLPFSFDITKYIKIGINTLRLIVKDITDQSYYSYGKQRLQRGGMWYTPTSGIWQTVWLESVPNTYITKLKITPEIDKSLVNFKINCNSKFSKCVITIFNQEDNEVKKITTNEDNVDIAVSNINLWTPQNPYVYKVIINIDDLDEVESYFAYRKFSIGNSKYGPCFMLNNEPYFIHGILDQGYISDGGYTYPTDEAMKFDIIQMKKLGFNTLRKHAKIEPLRWYYHCDTIGMLVFQDIVNGGKYDFNFMTLLPTIGFTKAKDNKYRKFGRETIESREYFVQEMMETANLLYNCPSVAFYTIFNESWGQFDVLKLGKILKELDNTRIINPTSGWFDQGGGDLKAHHFYFKKVKIRKDKRPVMVTEFGGYSHKVKNHVFNIDEEYGYKKFKSIDAFVKALFDVYEKQIISNIQKGLCGSVYTQVSDVEDETNGLLTYDRKVNKLEAYDFNKISDKLKL